MTAGVAVVAVVAVAAMAAVAAVAAEAAVAAMAVVAAVAAVVARYPKVTEGNSHFTNEPPASATKLPTDDLKDSFDTVTQLSTLIFSQLVL